MLKRIKLIIMKEWNSFTNRVEELEKRILAVREAERKTCEENTWINYRC